MTGKGHWPNVGSLVTSSSAPLAPRSASAARSRPPSSRSTASAPGVDSRPVGPLPTPTTTASAESFSIGRSVAEIVGGTPRSYGRRTTGGAVDAGGPPRAPTSVSRVTSPQLSPLHERHAAAGAKLADFGGWSMPLEYAGGGGLAEHAAVREAVGLFDVSHLGTATVRGPGAAAFVDSCLTNDLSRIGPGQAQYTLCCDESGGVVDDLIVYLHGPDHVLL